MEWKEFTVKLHKHQTLLKIYKKFFEKEDIDINVLYESFLNYREYKNALKNKKFNPLDYWHKTFEVFEDDIESIKEEIKLNRYIKSFISNNYRKLLNEKSTPLFKQIMDLKVEYYKVHSAIFKKIAGCHTSFAFNDMLNSFIKNNNTYNLDSIVAECKKSGADVVGRTSEFVVAEVFNSNQVTQLGSSSWCIRHNHWFQNYTKDNNRQFIIWKLNTDYRNSLIGMTTSEDGLKIITAHDNHDSLVKDVALVGYRKYIINVDQIIKKSKFLNKFDFAVLLIRYDLSDHFDLSVLKDPESYRLIFHKCFKYDSFNIVFKIISSIEFKENIDITSHYLDNIINSVINLDRYDIFEYIFNNYLKYLNDSSIKDYYKLIIQKDNLKMFNIIYSHQKLNDSIDYLVNQISTFDSFKILEHNYKNETFGAFVQENIKAISYKIGQSDSIGCFSFLQKHNLISNDFMVNILENNLDYEILVHENNKSLPPKQKEVIPSTEIKQFILSLKEISFPRNNTLLSKSIKAIDTAMTLKLINGSFYILNTEFHNLITSAVENKMYDIVPPMINNTLNKFDTNIIIESINDQEFFVSEILYKKRNFEYSKEIVNQLFHPSLLLTIHRTDKKEKSIRIKNTYYNLISYLKMTHKDHFKQSKKDNASFKDEFLDQDFSFHNISNKLNTWIEYDCGNKDSIQNFIIELIIEKRSSDILSYEETLLLLDHLNETAIHLLYSNLLMNDLRINNPIQRHINLFNYIISKYHDKIFLFISDLSNVFSLLDKNSVEILICKMAELADKSTHYQLFSLKIFQIVINKYPELLTSFSLSVDISKLDIKNIISHTNKKSFSTLLKYNKDLYSILTVDERLELFKNNYCDHVELDYVMCQDLFAKIKYHFQIDPELYLKCYFDIYTTEYFAMFLKYSENDFQSFLYHVSNYNKDSYLKIMKSLPWSFKIKNLFTKWKL